ncbi:hypothetical protein B0H15DRAFT_921975 [Mycena belliarum]|uniref:Mediator of RNA polymerase II transcription subunit 21 n=1 Tax=Mycena belliarum TaxID=1033014 RepID=A0AAD6U7F0_9AGAR|nr:hypothetical protein B0H15DRAFT_921975 [Mycena belliae]
MLHELSHMDKITQLQDETQRLLNITARSLAYLTARADLVQVSAEVPVTRARRPETYDSAEVLEANKKELVADLIVKAKQVEDLIQSLPAPELEEQQAKRLRALDGEMSAANEEYIQAVARAKDLRAQVTGVLGLILEEP